MDLGHPDVAVQMDDLPLQVGILDRVIVDNTDGADPRCRKAIVLQ